MLKGKQQEILNLPYDGHGVVCGVAGSGKSFCAIKRAEFIEAVTNKKVLILSYNNSLINYMKDISGIKSSNIDLTTYHKFATNCMRNNKLLGYNDILSSDKEVEKLIDKAIENTIEKEGDITTLKRKLFLKDEIKWMQHFGALTKDVYEHIDRVGRGNANLRKVDRKYVFSVYEEYVKLRSEKGHKYDWDDLAYYFNNLLCNQNIEPQYGCIIIDEGQDFSPMMIKSIVNYINDKGSVLYLGDRGQQIYGKGNMSWKNLGLKIRKVYTLDENHRNTKQIEKLANIIRENLNLDIEDGIVSLNSITNGPKPKIVSLESKENEDKYIINLLKEYENNGSTCIIFRKNKEVINFIETLNTNNIYPIQIDKNTTAFNVTNGIFIGNYHSVKGLEFDNVIIARCSNSILEDVNKIPDKIKKELNESELDAYQKEQGELLAKLIYVAITRAKTNLVITTSDELISIIPRDTEICDFYESR